MSRIGAKVLEQIEYYNITTEELIERGFQDDGTDNQ